MKESGSILAARVFVDVKRITEEKVEFLYNSTVYWRRMVKSIYLIRHRFIKAVLFLDVIENR